MKKKRSKLKVKKLKTRYGNKTKCLGRFTTVTLIKVQQLVKEED